MLHHKSSLLEVLPSLEPRGFLRVLVGLEPQAWSFEMEVIPKIEGNNAFKEHLIGNSPKIEIKHFKGNFIDNPLIENSIDNTF